MGTMVSLENLTIPIRISNALISYVSYIGKLLWPHQLTLIYPHPGSTVSIWQSSASGLLMIFITLFVIKEMRWRPYLAFGWIWYVLTLSPVIGIFQAGSQPMADRFTYIPLIGLFICIAWGIPELFRKLPYRKIMLTVAAGLAVATCAVCTFFQLQHWKNGTTLFEHAIRVTANNYKAHYCLASELSRKGNLQKSIAHYRKALDIKPDYWDAWNGLGVALARQGKLKEAVRYQFKALELNPKNENYHNNLGVTLARQGKLKEAMVHYSRALKIRPDLLTARLNLAFILLKMGRHPDAIIHFQEALKIKADITEANFYLGMAYYLNGDRVAALKRHEILRSIDSDLADRLLNIISR
jgi:Flp pilus assembly protein TadD